MLSSPVVWLVSERVPIIFISLNPRRGGSTASEDKEVFFHQCNTQKQRTKVRRLFIDTSCLIK